MAEGRSARSSRYRRVFQQEDSSDEESTTQTPKRSQKTSSSKESADSFKKPAVPPTSRGLRGTQSSQSQRSQRRKRNSDSDEENPTSDKYDFTARKQMTFEEMLKNVVHFFTTVIGKASVKKSEILKNLMNKQNKDYERVMPKVEKGLGVFGLRLIGLKEEGNGRVICTRQEATSFIIVNKFRNESLLTAPSDQNVGGDVLKAALVIILTLIYMTDRPLTDEYLWEQLEKLEFTHLMCRKREEFKRVLKTEYEDNLYLSKKEEKVSPEQFETHTVYSWGIRAEAEISKYALLKFVAGTLGTRPQVFFSHYGKISKEEVKQIEDEDDVARRGRENRASSEGRVSPDTSAMSGVTLNESRSSGTAADLISQDVKPEDARSRRQ